MTSSPVAMTAALQRNASLLPLPSATAPQTVEPRSSPRKREDIAVEGQREEEERKEAERTTIASDDVARPRERRRRWGEVDIGKQKLASAAVCVFKNGVLEITCWAVWCDVVWCGEGEENEECRREEVRKCVLLWGYLIFFSNFNSPHLFSYFRQHISRIFLFLISSVSAFGPFGNPSVTLRHPFCVVKATFFI